MSDIDELIEAIGELRGEDNRSLHAEMDIVHQHLTVLENTVQPALGNIEKRMSEFGSGIGALSKTIRETRTGQEPPKPSAQTLLARVFACHILGAIHNQPAAAVVARLYPGKEQRIVQALAHPGQLVERGITNPALTTVAGWAVELVGIANAGVIPQIAPGAVYSRLSQRGIRVALDAYGNVRVIGRSKTPGIGGAFVGEGQAIPVRAIAFSAATLTTRTCGVISYYSREIAQSSVPAIEGLIRTNMEVDTANAVDGVLLDDQPATAVRPAGLRNGVAAIAPAAGGGLTALMGDIRNLVSAVQTTGNLADPVFICDQASALMIGLLAPYAMLQVVGSATCPTGMLLLADAADFVSAEGDKPDISASDEAVLHAADPASPLVDASVVAAPQVSLWETASLALRLITQCDWSMRRSGRIAWTEGVSW